MLRALLLAAALAVIVAPAGALAADTTVAADPEAQDVATLDGTLVWVRGEYGAQTLMTLGADGGPQRVPGAPEARYYASIDLGRDAAGDTVLSYLRCTAPGHCVARRDDLGGHRSSIGGLVPRGCAVTTAPALWRTRVAYGLGCRDAKRSGVWVKKRGSSTRRLPLPRDAARYGARTITAADLRGTVAAGVAADIYEYAFSQTVGGSHMTSFLAAASEGESDEHVRGLALGARGTLWALVDAEHVGDPNQAVVHRAAAGCHEWESMENDPGPDEESGYRATAIAVDGETVYLVVPRVGIVRHDFTPSRQCK